MQYKIKAVQYIRRKSEPGSWMAVDSITLFAEYEFDIQPTDKEFRAIVRRDVRKLLGRNWVLADIYAKI